MPTTVFRRRPQRRFRPVAPITNKGAFLTGFLSMVYGVSDVVGKRYWRFPKAHFEECPKYMRKRDAFYFGYKYYYRPPVESDPSNSIYRHFKGQHIRSNVPSGFHVENKVTISAGGDLMPYECINARSADRIWDDVGDFFFSSDIVFANLETPIDTSVPASVVPEVMLNDMYFNGSEEMFHIFNGNGQYKGLDIVSTANNHSMDMGESGLRNTLEYLDRKGILHTGTSRSEAERDDFPIIHKNGINIAFLAHTFSLNKMHLPKGKEYLANYIRLNKPDIDLEPIRRQVKLARKRGADIVIASLHCGNAYQPYPLMCTVDNMHRVFKETGVDIILGGHPHNPQPMEQYSFRDPFSGEEKTGFCIYSMGDFIAYDIFKWCHLPIIMKMDIVKGHTASGKSKTLLQGVQIKPVYTCGYWDENKEFKVQLLDLYKCYAQWQNGTLPAYFGRKQTEELLELKSFFEEHFLPANPEEVIYMPLKEANKVA